MFDNRLKYKWDNKNVLDYAVAIATAKGVKEGSHKKALAIALELKKAGFPTGKISQFTKLPVEKIESLKL